MNGNNQALLIGNPDSVVHAVERRFLALGLPSLSISDASEAVDVIREGRVVTFLAIDEAIGESAASEVLSAAKTLYPEAPVLWVGADRGPERFVYAPDAIISPLSKPNDAERAGEQCDSTDACTDPSKPHQGQRGKKDGDDSQRLHVRLGYQR